MANKQVYIPSFRTPKVLLLPGEAEVAVRREGVRIALDKRATLTWKNAWEAVSSRIVVVRLKWST